MKVDKTIGVWTCQLCDKEQTRTQITGKDISKFHICNKCIDKIYKVRMEEKEKAK